VHGIILHAALWKIGAPTLAQYYLMRLIPMQTPIERLLAHFGIVELPGWLAFLISIWHVLLILLLAWVLLRIVARMVRVLHDRMIGRSPDLEGRKRIETLTQVFRYAASVVISVVAIMLILPELGISIAPILATAGVAGIAVGFGAQSLVKDYFTGFVMLLENQIRQGDVVDIAGKSGLVEEVTLRYVRLRDYEGAVHFIPNGTIDTVTNRSAEFAFAVMDIGVSYREDVDHVFGVIRQVGAELKQDGDFSLRILEALEIAGVEQWADSAVMIKCRLKVTPLEQWNVRREFLRRLKRAFDEEGIEIPYPHRTLYAGSDRNAPPFPIRVLRAQRADGGLKAE
jgi:moderate conductance mechanosensitive channel